MGAIVRVDKRHYRKIAQENWGLTDEQMVGMHVHHRTPRSQGGTNDASNLYVCSPYFHGQVWHDGNYFAQHCARGGLANTEAQKQARREAGSVQCQRWHSNGANLRGRLKSIELRRTPIALTKISTGETFYFSSQINACKAFGLSKGNLNGVLNGDRSQHKGYTAEYVK